MHPTKLFSVSQPHIFTILTLFPMFLTTPPLLHAFDFSASVPLYSLLGGFPSLPYYFCTL